MICLSRLVKKFCNFSILYFLMFRDRDESPFSSFRM